MERVSLGVDLTRGGERVLAARLSLSRRPLTDRSLVSALLFDGGVVNRLCKVDEGNTTTDFDEDEIDRKITINTSVAHIEHRGVKVNLIDTPGYSIFSTDALQVSSINLKPRSTPNTLAAEANAGMQAFIRACVDAG